MPRRCLLALLPLLAVTPHGARAQPNGAVLVAIPMPDPADPPDRIGSWTAVDGDVDRNIPGSSSRTVVDAPRPPAPCRTKCSGDPRPPRDSR